MATNSYSIRKIYNDELSYFNEQMLMHEWISGDAHCDQYYIVGRE